MPFWAYMLHCRGGVFYIGHTDDLDRRIAEHRSGLIPGFTQDMHPLEVVWTQEFGTREEAKAAEKQIKGWSRKKKLALIRGDWAEISRLAKGKSGPSTSSGQTEVGVAIARQTSGHVPAPVETARRTPGQTPTPVCPELVEGQSFSSGAAFEGKSGPSTSSGQTVLGVRITLGALVDIRAEARRAAPEECCGILLGHNGLIEEARPAANVATDLLRRFEIDPQALVDAHRAARGGGRQILGYYHSHPEGRAEPSATDRAQSDGDGSVWAIVGEGDVTFWRDEEAGFVPLSYALEDR